jgi:hypothetical protein
MRKTILVLALLLCGALSLAAQSRSNASVYVAPVTGRGSKPDDNSFFYSLLLHELTVQKVIIANTQKDAEYSLFGSVAAYWGTGQFVFHLALLNNRTGETTVEGDLRYETPDDTDQLFSVLVTSLLYTIPPDAVPPVDVPPEPVPSEPVPPDDIPDIVPEEPVKTADWRDNWLFLGMGAQWTPGLYKKGYSQSNFPAGLQGGPSAEFHFLDFMSLETAVEVQFDGVRASNTDAYSVIIGMPLLIKFVFKPGSIFMLEPYVGPYFNVFHIGNITPAFISARAGLQFSVKVGPGALFFDGGFTGDFLPFFDSKSSNIPKYNRYYIHVGLGYKFGLFQREIK